ncbi:MAG: hypothetical protein MK078_11035 [Crocinitomicaceae bacterium]|nr:hypothetical protein [Crocinitomicaceae bacterium]
MRVGIVKEKYSKSFRWIFYIGVPLLLLSTYLLLMLVNIDLGFTWLVLAIICIAGFVFIDKVVDDIIILGEVAIREDSFVFDLKENVITIPFNEIRMILLKPMLGVSRVADTFKVYNCQIKTNDNLYIYQITREEIKSGKLIAKNLMNPRAFDFIRFLEKQKINHRFGKRIY